MAKESWRGLTLREKIGQTVVSYSGSPFPSRMIEDFERYSAGGVFVGAEVIKDSQENLNKIEQVTARITHYRNSSKVPLLVCSDMENGCGTMIGGLTPFPHLMALGAAGSVDLAYEYGKATALEARSIGVNWTFSPVVDLQQNRFNPITQTRAVSDDPKRAIPLLRAVMRGMQDFGLAATAKHFPGDGTDYRDQHLVISHNLLSLDQWWENHGAVFQAMIDAGVHSIMTGHIALPAWPTPDSEGRFLPATLSRELTTGLLKEKMGFTGVVVSDALVMGGFIRGREEKARARQEVESFNAGTDLLLWPTNGYFDAMEQALENGDIPMARLEDALERIWRMKEQMGLWEQEGKPVKKLSSEDRQYILQVAQETAERSLTLLRDRRNRLPLVNDSVKKVLIVVLASDESFCDGFSILKSELEIRGIEVLVRRNRCDNPPLATLSEQVDLIVYALCTWPHRPAGPVNFTGEEAGGLWHTLTAGLDKSIVVSFGSPYHFQEYFEMADIFINAYSPVPATQKALVRALWGEIPFSGQSPVRL